MRDDLEEDTAGSRTPCSGYLHCSRKESARRLGLSSQCDYPRRKQAGSTIKGGRASYDIRQWKAYRHRKISRPVGVVAYRLQSRQGATDLLIHPTFHVTLRTFCSTPDRVSNACTVSPE